MSDEEEVRRWAAASIETQGVGEELLVELEDDFELSGLVERSESESRR